MNNHAPRRDKQSAIPIAAYLDAVVQLGERFASKTQQRCKLEDAQGRVLAVDLTAAAQVPGFANSAMDGYAIQLGSPAETGDPEGLTLLLRIVGDQPAGVDRGLRVGPGEAVRIMTGAPIPIGADTVVESELTEEKGDSVEISGSVRLGANIRHPGEDIAVDDVVLEAGTKLGPRQLSAAAAIGTASVLVRPRLKVGIVSTGDELVAPGEEIQRGQIYESNSWLLAALVEEGGGEAVIRAGVPDQVGALAEVLDELTGECDAVLLSGGASVGRYDVVRNLLDGTPEAVFQRVTLQPGKPQGRAVWNGVPLLAFPGNPVGAFVSFHVFGKPFLRALNGEIVPPVFPREAIAGADWKTPQGRTQYIAGRLERDPAGELVFNPVSAYGSGSHLVTALARATALAVVPPRPGRMTKGEPVQVEELL